MGKLQFFFELKLKGCEKVFRKGMSPGVLISQTVTFKPKEGASKGMLVKALLDAESDFIAENIEVITTLSKGEGIDAKKEKDGFIGAG